MKRIEDMSPEEREELRLQVSKDLVAAASRLHARADQRPLPPDEYFMPELADECGWVSFMGEEDIGPESDREESETEGSDEGS